MYGGLYVGAKYSIGSSVYICAVSCVYRRMDGGINVCVCWVRFLLSRARARAQRSCCCFTSHFRIWNRRKNYFFHLLFTRWHAITRKKKKTRLRCRFINWKYSVNRSKIQRSNVHSVKTMVNIDRNENRIAGDESNKRWKWSIKCQFDLTNVHYFHPHSAAPRTRHSFFYFFHLILNEPTHFGQTY